MAKTKKKEVQKQGLRPSQKAKAEKLKKKQEAKAKIKEEKATQSVSTTTLSKTDITSKDTKAIKAQDSSHKITKSTSKSSETDQNTTKTSKSSTSTSKQASSSSIKTIHVKNAEGEPDTIAEILIQNKIDYTPKVSVVMPVYNVEPYLRQCLDSVLNQTLKEIEIICVDDGSTDSSLDILKEYAEKDKRITVITQKNLYAGVARNAGLLQAKGEYLSFLDSDDFFELTLLEETYNLAEKEQSQIIFYQYTNYDNELQQCDGSPRGISKILTNKEYITFKTSSLKDDLFTLCNPMPWNKLINRELAIEEDLHFQSLKASNDVCFSLNILACADKITLYYKNLVYYRYNRKGSLKNTRDKAPLNFYEAYKGIYDTLRNKKLYEKYKKTFLTSFVSSSLWTLANTDEKHQLVKDFIKNTIIPQYIRGNEELLDESLLNRLQRVYHPDIIVSLTSYPARIGTIHLVIDSILEQSMKADKVILWLAPEQFPNKEANLPQELLALQAQGLTIDWYHDIRSYKKLIPTLKKYPEAIIITADDDNIYQKDWLKKLFNSYVKYPLDIQAHRVTKFHFANGRFYTVSGGREYYKGANYLNKLVGVGGVLYPPHCFYKDILNEDLIKQLAPTNDDQWFWLQATMNGVKVRVVDNPDIEAHLVDGTQETGLTNINDHGENLFWKDFNQLLRYYPRLNKILQDEYKRNMKQYRNDSPYKDDVMNWYKRIHRKPLDLNCPKTFNEKIQWLKLYDSTPIKTRLADKYLVRDWVKEKIGEEYLIPLLGVYDSFDEIDFDKLPNQFVIKCNHGSGYNIIVKDKSELDLQDTKEKLVKWMNENFAFHAGCELHYLKMKPKIIIEKYMDDGTGDLRDYKYTCFNGKPEFIWIDSDRHTEHKRNLYDLTWKQLPYKVNSHYETFLSPERPKCLEDMNRLASILSKGFPYVRVDFYIINEKIYFGEMTFTSSSGSEDIQPKSFDQYLADKIRLPQKAYDIESGKYYKLHRNSWLKSFMLYPYYWFKIKKLQQEKIEKIKTILISQLSGIRIDIKNKGISSNDVEINSDNLHYTKPKWFTGNDGTGYLLQGSKQQHTIKMKIFNDGKLELIFRGQEKKYNNRRIPIWIDYKSIKIDDKEILSAPISVWHDKPFKYEVPVKDGQEITLKVVQEYHEYTENELKDILLKLNSDNDYICDNIKIIVSELKKQLPIIDEKAYQKQQIENYKGKILFDLNSYRLDIKNHGAEDNTIEVINFDGNIEEPKWFADVKGIGKVLKSSAINNIIKLKITNDGILKLDFRGQDRRFERKRIPLWIDYKSIKIDGAEILPEPISVWHDKPYRYEMPVKDGQEITLEIEQQCHGYSKEELKDILLKLYYDNEFIKANIGEIIEKILQNTEVYTVRLIYALPQILADCFIPLGIACRPARWLKEYGLRNCSFPFDWMMNFPLSTVISTLKYGVSSWFNEYVEDEKKKSSKKRYVTDVANHIISMHGFPADKSVEEYMPEFKEIFSRRCERMKNILETSENVCFVCNRNDTSYDFILFLKELLKIYPKLKIQLLNIRHSEDENKIMQYIIGDNVIIYDIIANDVNENGADKTNPKFWIGNERLWNDVCSNLFLLDEVKKENYNLINSLQRRINEQTSEEEKFQIAEKIFDLKNIKILTQQETVAKIKKEKISIARYGDGEIQRIFNPKFSEKFQRGNVEQSERLKEVFLHKSKDILICMDQHWENGVELSEYYQKVVSATKFDVANLCNFNSVFGNTGITRNANNIPSMKEIWQDKDIIIVEGELSRIGIGNDLFDNVKSLQRILCPAENAFNKYDDILEECKKQSQDKLFLIALGPTATILAYDLAKLGYWALDVGHMDICYEWKLRGNKGKIKVPGKYVNEVAGGNVVEDCTDPDYLNSIIAKVA